MKELVSKGLIERVGEYNAKNPIYKGLRLKTADEEEKGKKQKGAKKEKKVKEETEEPAEDEAAAEEEH